MESASKAWVLVTAIIGGLLAVVVVLGLVAALFIPRAMSILSALSEQPRPLVAAPVRPFRVPDGYLLNGGLSGVLPGDGSATYRMASQLGASPDVIVLAAYQNAEVSFAEAWVALGVPNCRVYGEVHTHALRWGRGRYEVSRQDCAPSDVNRRVEYALLTGRAGSTVMVAWGRASDWREPVIAKVLASLGR